MAFSSVLSSSGTPGSAKQNVPSPRALFGLQLGKTDLMELAPDLVRRATQEKMRICKPSPGCIAGTTRSGVVIAGPWAMAGVLLQKQAEPATALLPHWLSGYAFLFIVDTNLDRAKEMLAAWVANFAARAASPPPAQLPQASLPDAAGEHR